MDQQDHREKGAKMDHYGHLNKGDRNLVEAFIAQERGEPIAIGHIHPDEVEALIGFVPDCTGSGS